MSAFPDWTEYAFPQRHEKTGCIPTGYEVLLRAAQVGDVDFSTFQEDFDLELNGEGRNHFGSVACKIHEKYPHVKLCHKTFDCGADKLAFVEEQIAKQRPVLISLSNGPGKGWHIMPVVDADNDHLVLLNKVNTDGSPEQFRITKSDFVTVHDTCSGGEEVAFVDHEQRE